MTYIFYCIRNSSVCRYVLIKKRKLLTNFDHRAEDRKRGPTFSLWSNKIPDLRQFWTFPSATAILSRKYFRRKYVSEFHRVSSL